MVAKKRNPARFLGNFITLAVEGPQFWGLARTVRRCVSRPPNQIRALRRPKRPFSAVFGRFPAVGHFGRKSPQDEPPRRRGRRRSSCGRLAKPPFSPLPTALWRRHSRAILLLGLIATSSDDDSHSSRTHSHRESRVISDSSMLTDEIASRIDVIVV